MILVKLCLLVLYTDEVSTEPLNKLDSEMRARQKQSKKRSLHEVNEHFEIVFNTAITR